MKDKLKQYVLLLLLLLLWLPFVVSGFIHEGGHAAVAEWVGIEVTGFSPTKCFLLRCRVVALEPLEGWRGRAVLLAGGLSASLWWLAIYLATIRWHRTERWWLGGVTAAFFTGGFTSALLEGGWDWLYSNYALVALLIIVLGMAAGFVAQLKVTGQAYRIRQFWGQFKGSKTGASWLRNAGAAYCDAGHLLAKGACT